MKFLAAAIVFSTLVFAQNPQPVSGRLIDLVCGSMVLRGETYKIIHSPTCLNDARARGGLAVVSDENSTVVRLNPEQEKVAIGWRTDLSRGEVYVRISKSGKIEREHRNVVMSEVTR